MYLEFYQLTDQPFTLSPNPQYLYYSNQHKEALSQMIYAITQESGFMVLTGEVGTGKTILVQALLETLPDDYSVANIHYTALSPKGLLQAVCKAFAIPFTNQTMAELVFKLQTFFKEQYHSGKKAVLIVDEAQNLSRNNLEVIRLFTNLQSTEEKFVQIILVGQPELNVTLRDKNLRQLKERIGLRFHLKKLPAKEISEYIKHRLSVAGNADIYNIFRKSALKRINALTGGIPRRVNVICDNALIYGYSKNVRPVTVEILDEVAAAEIEAASGEATSPFAETEWENGTGKKAKQAAEKNTIASAETSIDKDTLMTSMKTALAENNFILLKKPKLVSLLWSLFIGFVLMVASFLTAAFLAKKMGLLP